MNASMLNRVNIRQLMHLIVNCIIHQRVITIVTENAIEVLLSQQFTFLGDEFDACWKLYNFDISYL